MLAAKVAMFMSLFSRLATLRKLTKEPFMTDTDVMVGTSLVNFVNFISVFGAGFFLK